MNLPIFFLPTICCLVQMGLFVAGYVELYTPSPERRPGGCYSDATGHLIEKQVVEIKGKCESATCESSGHIRVHGCGSVWVEGKTCEYDYSKPYPKCCPCGEMF